MIMHEKTTDAILGAAVAVHRALGPGLLESAYQECLCYELSERGVQNSTPGPAADSVRGGLA